MNRAFGPTIVKLAKNKQKKLSDKEYNDWLCQLSDEFASMFN